VHKTHKARTITHRAASRGNRKVNRAAARKARVSKVKAKDLKVSKPNKDRASNKPSRARFNRDNRISRAKANRASRAASHKVRSHPNKAKRTVAWAAPSNNPRHPPRHLRPKPPKRNRRSPLPRPVAAVGTSHRSKA